MKFSQTSYPTIYAEPKNVLDTIQLKPINEDYVWISKQYSLSS